MAYDYQKDLHDDIKDYIENEFSKEEITERLRTEDGKEEFAEKLYDDLWVEDSVTGNASGSYTNNAKEAYENIKDNLDLLAEALSEFGEDLSIKNLRDKAEWCDVTIRCYLLNGAVNDVLEEFNYPATEDDPVSSARLL